MAMGGLGSGRGKRGGGFSEINVTPMVDVMLVLIIVFMVAAPLLTTTLRVELPNVEAKSAESKDTKLIVSIDENEKIYFGETPTEDIEDVLLTNARVQKEKELYIRADKKARYGVVARVVAAARAAGVEGLNLLVQPEAVGPETGAATAAPAGATTAAARAK